VFMVQALILFLRRIFYQNITWLPRHKTPVKISLLLK
jgi:hypothetical protein